MLPFFGGALPKIKFTAIAVEKIAPPAQGQVDYFDASFPAFGFRVGKSGRKTWFVMVRVHGKLARISLGRIGPGGMDLADARKKAGEVIDLAKQGHDPRNTLKLEQAENQKRSEMTIAVVAKDFIKRYAKKRKRSWREDQRILDVYVTPTWGRRPIDTITRADVVRLLDDVEEAAQKKTGKGFYMANRVLACVRKMFNWAMDERALIESNPVGRNMARGTEGTRKKKFEDAQIKAIWKAADKVGGFKGAAVKMLLLTGQRVSVVAGMRHSEVDVKAKLWRIRGDEVDRSKNKLDHVVPLSEQALAVYQSVPKVEEQDHVFSSGTKGDLPLAIGSKLNDEIRKAANFEDWTWQNLRSIVATKMKRPLGITSEIIDRVQGRLPQSVLARNYDANDYLEDKRAALQAWANLLDQVVSDRGRGNVVPMKGVADG